MELMVDIILLVKGEVLASSIGNLFQVTINIYKHYSFVVGLERSLCVITLTAVI